MKKVLFAASEAVPFMKTGGLADVAGSLPKYFDSDEYDVRVIMPKYLCMKSEFCEGLKLICECQVRLGWRLQYAGVLETECDGITYYFIDNEYYFAGPAPYGQIYQDAEKFAYFSKAVLTVLPEIDFCPDVIHCHDWQTGLVPVFLNAFYKEDNFYRYIKTVYSIHNLKFQGRWYIDAIKDVTGLGDEYFSMGTLESYGSANLLKGGVVFSDYVTTVSDTYAKEIQTSEGGEGLDGLMRSKSFSLAGIVNGIDYDIFDPKTDPLIEMNLEDDVFAYKKANKKALQREYSLNEDEDVFLVGMVSRLTDQKGFDLVDYILDELLATCGMQLIVLGTGERRYEEMFRFYSGKYPGRVSAQIYYSEETAHRIYASCDAFLMPSLFEPCGLSQLISLRYGTVPMVRQTGGLKDTVEAYNEFEHTGTGFTFFNYNAHEMMYMIRYANKIYSSCREEWEDIVLRGMAQDFSWNVSSGKYALIYEELIERANAQKAEEERLREEQRLLEEKQKENERLAKEAKEKRLEEERLAKEAEEKRLEEERLEKEAKEKRLEKEKSAAAAKEAAKAAAALEEEKKAAPADASAGAAKKKTGKKTRSRSTL